MKSNYNKKYERLELIEKMEKEFHNKNIHFFSKLSVYPDPVIRTRAICIIADLGGENAVETISKALKEDVDELVRHEAAFSLGQLGFRNAIKPLSDAVEKDPSIFVRHEAAIALGVIGSEDARSILLSALNDPSEEVKKSAIVALSNLDYILNYKKINKFTRMTGG